MKPRIKALHGRLGVIVVVLLFASTAVHAGDFTHDINTGPQPWTDKSFDVADDRFMFAVHSDLTGGERPDVFDVALAQISLLRPEFVISVGDLIEGGEITRDDYENEWEAYDERVDRLKAPLFYVGGNHDLTTVLAKEIWAERYGPSYYHFRYKDVLFLVLDTEDNPPERVAEIAEARALAVEIYKTEGPEAFTRTDYAQMPERSAGTISAEQADYLTTVIEKNADVRWTFLFVHKPAWQRKGDNNFAAIEAALSGHPYTVFNGHVQAYDHTTRMDQDYIQLATTGGEQFPDKGMSEDHITLVTVSGDEVDIATLLLEGIRDRTGRIPEGGDELCFAVARCGTQQ